MKRWRSWLVALFLAIVAAPVGPKEPIEVDFSEIDRAPPEALAHVGLKAVVTEFLDPAATGLGSRVAELLQNETYNAISDQAGAGVILAESEEPLVDMLELSYHEAATEIARSQKARMVLWGSIEPLPGSNSDTVLVSIHLTTLTLTGASDLRIPIGDPENPLEVTIPRTRFNFSPIPTTKSELRTSGVFSAPAVHFLAGLYRFYDGQYKAAAREFEQFAEASDTSHINLAAAHQLRGASLLLSGDQGEAKGAFSRAIEETPHDPAAYRLRSVARLGDDPLKAIEDLEKARSLDPRDSETLRLIQEVKRIAGAAEGPPAELGRETGLDR